MQPDYTQRYVVLFRADASSAMGTGHVMRCIALAQAALARNWHCIFLTRGGERLLRDHLRSEEIEIVPTETELGRLADAHVVATMVRRYGIAWVVIDGYGIPATVPSSRADPPNNHQLLSSFNPGNPRTISPNETGNLSLRSADIPPGEKTLGFDEGYLENIRASGARVLLVDDYGHHVHYDADCILNPNITSYSGLYERRSPYTTLLLGTRFVPLRKEFLLIRGTDSERETTRESASIVEGMNVWRGASELDERHPPLTGPRTPRIVISFGGADPENATGLALDALLSLKRSDWKVDVVLGGFNPHAHIVAEKAERLADSLRSAARPDSIRILRDVRDMAAVFAGADLAIIAGGSTCWETLFLDVPSLVLILAENQAAIAKMLDALGVVRCVGWARDLDASRLAALINQLLSSPKETAQMQRRGQGLVDGRGADRILERLQAPQVEPSFRRASFADVIQLWHIANEPSIRQCGFYPASISLADHVIWLEKKLASPASLLFVIEDGGAIVGQVRYDRISVEAAEIGISLLPPYRGRGLGTRMISETLSLVCQELGVSRILANVRMENPTSIHLFEKLGFQRCGEGVKNGFPFVSLDIGPLEVPATSRENG